LSDSKLKLAEPVPAVSLRGKREAGTVRSLVAWARKHGERYPGRAYELRTASLSEELLVQDWAAPEDDAIEHWAADVLECAAFDAEERGSITEYRLVVVVDGRDGPARTIRRRPEGMRTLPYSSDPDGLVKQAQAHTEAANRQLHMGYTATLGALGSICEQLMKRNAELEKMLMERDAKHAEVVQLHREAMEALNEAVARDADLEKQARMDKRMERWMNLFEGQIAAAANKAINGSGDAKGGK
jgi:hypothetical protein